MNFRRDIWSSLDVHQRNQSQIMYHQIQSADGIHTANIPNNSLLSNGSGSLSETSNQENDDDLDMNVDGEGVWSPDIELCFQPFDITQCSWIDHTFPFIKLKAIEIY
ncbi:hypothetical protein GJ496_002728 [Pomphorhynchus laevis]|nr:hypothetical protein GJ496_002728 [Pomphorhynchus laevis]